MSIATGATLATLFTAAAASAQRSGTETTSARGAARPATERLIPQRGGAGMRGQQLGADRMALERQVRQSLARVARRQLGLTDEQMRSLGRVDQRFEQRRRELNRDETMVRIGLRQVMLDTGNVDQAKVAQSLDRLIQLQRRRVDLLEAEQRALAEFLTPLQRAQYQSLQERVRRRLEEARPNAAGGAGRRPPLEPGPPPLR
jgi:periplasmic protein CpxP/Spy